MASTQSSAGDGKASKPAAAAVVNSSITSSEKTMDRTAALIEANRRGDAACLVCIEPISKRDPMWSCQHCFVPFHLACIQQWASSVLSRHAGPNARQHLAVHTPQRTFWYCPSCRQDIVQQTSSRNDSAYHSTTEDATTRAAPVPSTYRCFCGGVENPVSDAWVDPHSCGEICGALLRRSADGSTCGHTCTMRCHPGMHPQCPQMIDAPCFGEHGVQKRRCHMQQWSCGQACALQLPCGHPCAKPCHQGPCPPCKAEPKLFACRCGRQRELRSCANMAWKCKTVCGKALECGRHSCNAICHAGRCEPCATNAHQRTCPCGAVTVQGVPCDQDVPSCGGTCGRMLVCGRHPCTRRCHAGACGPCVAVSTLQCDCGASHKAGKCGGSFRCKTRCQRMRSCQRHKCGRRCCSGGGVIEESKDAQGASLGCSVCPQVCGRRLACGSHRCELLCHASACPPCPAKIEVACACGSTCMEISCQQGPLPSPPPCILQCAKLRSAVAEGGHVDRKSSGAGGQLMHHRGCGHAIVPHKCHFGACPPCKTTCGKPFANCEHSCSKPCHFGSTKTEGDYSTGAAAAPAKKKQRHKSAGMRLLSDAVDTTPPSKFSCPPCSVRVSRVCAGKHGEMSVPCSSSDVSCKLECGQLLSCTRHRCELPCHEITLPMSGGVVADTIDYAVSLLSSCRQCKRACSLSRPRGCRHTCGKKTCHAGECPPCTKYFRSSCHCGHVKSQVNMKCHKYAAMVVADEENGSSNVEQLISCGRKCSRRRATCGHMCAMPCHKMACETIAPECTHSVMVQCRCGQRKEAWSCSRASKVRPGFVNMKGGDAGSVSGEQKQISVPGDEYSLLSCDVSLGCLQGAAVNEKKKKKRRKREKGKGGDDAVHGTRVSTFALNEKPMQTSESQSLPAPVDAMAKSAMPATRRRGGRIDPRAAARAALLAKEDEQRRLVLRAAKADVQARDSFRQRLYVALAGSLVVYVLYQWLHG